MAIYHLNVKTGSRDGGQSARARAQYIAREGKDETDRDELAHSESGNMPSGPRTIPGTIGPPRTHTNGSTGGCLSKWSARCRRN